MKAVDVVVIGAGVNGASTAFNLVTKGAKKVLLIDKHLIASGGTGRSAAIVRQHYSSEVLVRMVMRSIDVFHHFDEAIGGSAGFVKSGYAFLVPKSSAEPFRRNIELQQRLGVDTRIISKEDLLEIEPRLELSDVDQICYEPGSGYADPHDTTYSYVKRFRELGGELLQMTSVDGLIGEFGAVRGVRTSKGDIAAGAVVNAAGPWAQSIAKFAGVDLPSRSRARKKLSSRPATSVVRQSLPSPTRARRSIIAPSDDRKLCWVVASPRTMKRSTLTISKSRRTWRSLKRRRRV